LFWETGFELVESNLHEKYLIEDKNAVNLGISKFDLNDSQWFRVSVFKMFGGIGDNRSAHGRGGPSPFSMKKRTKIHVIRNASLPHMGLCPAKRLKPGLQSFYPASRTQSLRFSKNLLCPATLMATNVLTVFGRSLSADEVPFLNRHCEVIYWLCRTTN